MPIPQPGDVLIRNVTAGRYELVDAVSLRLIDGPFGGFPAAVAAARLRNARAIWQQNVDSRGRPLGDPIRWPSS
jgi:hypothetical protein